MLTVYGAMYPRTTLISVPPTHIMFCKEDPGNFSALFQHDIKRERDDIKMITVKFYNGFKNH